MREAPNAAAELYWGLLYGLISIAMPIGYLLDPCWAGGDSLHVCKSLNWPGRL
jgi:hypothetical protein